MIEKFENIGGYEYAKQEAIKIANYFKNYEKFKSNGARLPKGILFYGEPGTGKTLFAKSIVNESKAKAYSLNTENLYEGEEITLSIKKVFDEARKNAPSIILINELDRLVDCSHSPFSGSSDDGRETLRCLLTEVDKSKDYDILIIATSNASIYSIPSPLVREGRIEKHIFIDMPSYEDREKILSLYLSNNDVFKNVTASSVAYYTNGLSGAGLATLVNDVLIECINNEKEADFKDFLEPIEAIKTSNIKLNVNKENVDHIIYHELGHFITNYVLNDEIGMISITPYANNSGGRLSLLKGDNNMESSSYTSCFNKCVSLVAGNEAVNIFLNERYLGSSSDLKSVTGIYRKMLDNGMFEELDIVSIKLLSSGEEDMPIGGSDVSCDGLIGHFTSFYENCVNKAKDIINKNKDVINALFKELKVKTYLIEDDIKEIIKEHPVII